jgi:hypothetical protein
MNKTYLKKTLIAAIAGLLALAMLSVASPASATTTLDAQDAEFTFANDDDFDLEVGETYLYEDVVTLDGMSIDALLTVDAFTEGSSLDYVDEGETYGVDTRIEVGCGVNCDPFEEEFTPEDGFFGSIQYTINFFEAGTDTPVTLENFSFYVRDIDTYQYIEVLDPDSYIVDGETNLSAIYHSQNDAIAPGNVRFQEMGGLDSENEDQPHWVEIKFDSMSSLTYKVGQDVPSGAFFSVRFRPVTFDNPVEFEAVPPAPMKISKKVFFDGDSAYLKPIWFKKLDKMIASVPACASGVTAKVISGVKKAKSEVKGSKLATRRAAIVKKFLTKRGLDVDVTLIPNGKGTKAKNNQRFAKIVINYNGGSCTPK